MSVRLTKTTGNDWEPVWRPSPAAGARTSGQVTAEEETPMSLNRLRGKARQECVIDSH